MVNLKTRAWVVIGIFVVFIAAFLFFARRDYTKDTERLDVIILQAVRDCGAPDRNFYFGKQEKGRSGGHVFLKITRRYEVGSGFSFEKFQSEIEKRLRNTGFKITKSWMEKNADREERSICFSFKNRIIYEVSF